MNKLLSDIYKSHTNPAGLKGIDKLYNAARKINPTVRKSDVISDF